MGLETWPFAQIVATRGPCDSVAPVKKLYAT